MEIVSVLRKSARYDTLILSIGLTLAAIACARIRGEMEGLPASLCFLFAAFAQVGGNFAHRHYDAQYHYGEGIDDRLRGCGIHTNENTIRQITGIAAQGTLILSATVGLAMLMMSGWWTLVPAAIIYGLIYFNFGAPHPIYRTVWAPIVPFLCFGTIGIGAAAMMQIYHDNPDPFAWYYLSPCVFTSTAMGFLAANVQLVHGFNFIDRDRENLKQSFSVRFGRNATIATVFFFGIAYGVLTSIFAFTQYVRKPWIASLIALVPMLYTLWICIRMKRQKGDDPTDLNARLCMGAYLLAGLGAFIFSFCFGDPDRSRLMYILFQ